MPLWAGGGGWRLRTVRKKWKARRCVTSPNSVFELQSLPELQAGQGRQDVVKTGD